MKIEELQKSIDFDLKKVEECIRSLEKILQDQNLNVGELLLVYGNLGYKMGANLRRALSDPKFKSEPPDLDILNKLYYTNASIDVALMITSLQIVSWIDDLENEAKEIKQTVRKSQIS